MYRDGRIVCDSCQAEIAHVATSATEGWERLHNLCPRCFAERAKQAV